MAHYQTTDIFKGAFLLSAGGALSGITFNDRRIASFAINGKGIHQLDKDYDQGLALVNPVILRDSLNHLRDMGTLKNMVPKFFHLVKNDS